MLRQPTEEDLLLQDFSLQYPEGPLDCSGKHVHHAACYGTGVGQNTTRGLDSSTDTPLDFSSKHRPHYGGQHYFALALLQLQNDFPLIPVDYPRPLLWSFNRFYAPTYLFLHAQEKEFMEQRNKNQKPVLPYTLRTFPFTGDLSCVGANASWDPAFAAERVWLLQELEHREFHREIECGCCFSDFVQYEMASCPEKHRFCKDCITSHASSLLVGHKSSIRCMDISGCTANFPESELRRFLPHNLFKTWQRLHEAKRLSEAGLKRADCPFCLLDWVVDAGERVLRCQNVKCGRMSCVCCKELNHLPKTCEEYQMSKLHGRHAVEEAMTNALKRNCPKCRIPFVKEAGCNRITCPVCGTWSCYVCREEIKGYAHFYRTGLGNGCPLDVVDRAAVEHSHAAEVAHAGERAAQDYAHEKPDVEMDDIRVTPTPTPAPASPPVNAIYHPVPLQPGVARPQPPYAVQVGQFRLPQGLYDARVIDRPRGTQYCLGIWERAPAPWVYRLPPVDIPPIANDHLFNGLIDCLRRATGVGNVEVKLVRE